MKKTLLVPVILLLHACMCMLNAQTITRVEYFFNTDPGFGNATAVPLTPATDITSLAFTANIAALPDGLHRLFLRSQRSDGVWGVTNSWMFFKSGQFSPVNIDRLEYFFDTDPGFGSGTAVPIGAAPNVSNLVFNADISTLALGLHTLFVRTQSNDGAWSQTTRWLFYKASFTGAGNISAVEYFFDTDPGFGNGTPVSFTPSTNLSDLNFNVSVSGLSAGTHRLFVRSRDAAGNWSISNAVEFERTFPLPVNWRSFTAEKKDAYVYLQWQTDNEVNNDSYEIEHGIDGLNYRKIATTAPQAGQGVHTYTYLHQTPSTNGINYYRIKQIDLDGKFTYSATRSVRMNTNQLFTISPIPAKDFIEVKSSQTNIMLRLFDMNGRQVHTTLMVSGNGRVNLTSLSTGSYLAVIEQQGKVLETIKIIKQ